MARIGFEVEDIPVRCEITEYIRSSSDNAIRGRSSRSG